MTVALASAVFGEALGAAQLAGGALVLAAVVAVRAPKMRPGRERRAPAAAAATLPAAELGGPV